MPNDYVSDYEALYGRKPEPTTPDTISTEAKVVEPAAKAAPKKTTAKAETK